MKNNAFILLIASLFMLGCGRIYTLSKNNCTDTTIDIQSIKLLQDSAFIRKLYIIHLRKDSVWGIKHDTIWNRYENLEYRAYHTHKYWYKIEERNSKMRTTNIYWLREGQLTIEQYPYFLDSYGFQQCHNNIGKSYKVLPNNEIITTAYYDTIYPICWREAMRIGLRTKHIKANEIQCIGIRYPDEEASFTDLKAANVMWEIESDRRYIYINPFTGKVTEKGYIRLAPVEGQETGTRVIRTKKK